MQAGEKMPRRPLAQRRAFRQASAHDATHRTDRPSGGAGGRGGPCPGALPEALADTNWRLVAIDAESVDLPGVTLAFGADGTVGGRAPCNRYGAQVLSVAPDFRLGAIRATRMACPALAQEQAFFARLDAARLAEVTAEGLVLSAPDGRRLVVSPAPPAD